jgi:hypothetical protein
MNDGQAAAAHLEISKRDYRALCNLESERIKRGLDIATRYWLDTIQRFTVNRKLRGSELWVAQHGYAILREAYGEANEWNQSDEGRLAPIPLPDFKDPKFLEPEPLYAENLPSAETMAMAAWRELEIQKSGEPQPAAEVLRDFCDAFLAAERYRSSFPQKPAPGKQWIENIRLVGNEVNLEEIFESNGENKGNTGGIPLLPPSNVKGRSSMKLGYEISGTQTKAAIQKTIELYYKEHGFDSAGTSISAWDLCMLRWGRFISLAEKQRSIALAREANKRTAKHGRSE